MYRPSWYSSVFNILYCRHATPLMGPLPSQKSSQGDISLLIFTSSKDFKHDAHSDFIHCVAYDSTSIGTSHFLTSSRLYSSTDFFHTNTLEELGMRRESREFLRFPLSLSLQSSRLKTPHLVQTGLWCCMYQWTRRNGQRHSSHMHHKPVFVRAHTLSSNRLYTLLPTYLASTMAQSAHIL